MAENCRKRPLSGQCPTHDHSVRRGRPRPAGGSGLVRLVSGSVPGDRIRRARSSSAGRRRWHSRGEYFDSKASTSGLPAVGDAVSDTDGSAPDLRVSPVCAPERLRSAGVSQLRHATLSVPISTSHAIPQTANFLQSAHRLWSWDASGWTFWRISPAVRGSVSTLAGRSAAARS